MVNAGIEFCINYTSAPEAYFTGGLWSQTHATDNGNFTSTEAVRYTGASRWPDKVVVIRDRYYFRFVQVTPPHKDGPGGANDYEAMKPVPPHDILDIRPVPYP